MISSFSANGGKTMVSLDKRFDDRFFGGPTTVLDIYKMNHMYNCPITAPGSVMIIYLHEQKKKYINVNWNFFSALEEV